MWTISTSSWAHRHGNVPKRESQNVSKCVKGHMNYGLTLNEALFLIDPELIIFGRPQSSPVSCCCRSSQCKAVMYVSIIVQWWFSVSEWHINLRPQSQNNGGFQPLAVIIQNLYRLRVVSGGE